MARVLTSQNISIMTSGGQKFSSIFFESGAESDKEGDTRDQQEKKCTCFIKSSPGILHKGMEIEERDPSRELLYLSDRR